MGQSNFLMTSVQLSCLSVPGPKFSSFMPFVSNNIHFGYLTKRYKKDQPCAFFDLTNNSDTGSDHLHRLHQFHMQDSSKLSCRHRQRIFLQRPNAASTLAASNSQVMRKFPTTIVDSKFKQMVRQKLSLWMLRFKMVVIQVVKLAKGQEFVLDG